MAGDLHLPIIQGREDETAVPATEAPGLPDFLQNAAPATLALHGDEVLRSSDDVAHPIHVSSTFRYSDDPEQLNPSHGRDLRVQDSLPTLICQP